MTEFTTSRNGALQLAHPKSRVRALFGGHLLADTDCAVIVRETGEPERAYFPRESIEMEAVVATDFVRDFPGKGPARFFTIYRDASVIEHAAWSFEQPLAAAEDLRDLITFDLDVVTIEHDDGGKGMDAEAARMSEYIRHTDSGSGRSQDEPWPANVSEPSGLLGEDEEADERPVNVRP